MRDLLLLVVVFGSLPIILIEPFIGLLVYSWLAYMRPHDLVWGSVPQVSLFVALATIAGLVLATGREQWLTVKLQTLLLTAIGLWTGITSLTAIDPSLSREWAIGMAKAVLIGLFTTGLVQNRKRFRWLYLVIAFSLGGLGVKYGIYGLTRGGARFVEGPGGFMIDNNSFAMALNMGIPLLVGVALVDGPRWLRVAAWVSAICTAAAVVFTFSRGGLIALAIVLVILVARSGRPLIVSFAVVLAVAGFFHFTSSDFEQAYSERASSIREYESDDSATGRLEEWGTALRIFGDHPILGVGPKNLVLARPLYVLDGSPYKTTHNSFLQVLVASGVPGLLLFVSALAVSTWRLEMIRRSTTQQWARVYAGMIQTSFAAYVAGGMLLDMAYLDLIYQLMAMTVSLELAAAASQGDVRRVSGPSLSSGEPSEPEWWRTAPTNGQSGSS